MLAPGAKLSRRGSKCRTSSTVRKGPTDCATDVARCQRPIATDQSTNRSIGGTVKACAALPGGQLTDLPECSNGSQARSDGQDVGGTMRGYAHAVQPHPKRAIAGGSMIRRTGARHGGTTPPRRGCSGWALVSDRTIEYVNGLCSPSTIRIYAHCVDVAHYFDRYGDIAIEVCFRYQTCYFHRHGRLKPHFQAAKTANWQPRGTSNVNPTYSQ
jgi:hypothetical protein